MNKFTKNTIRLIVAGILSVALSVSTFAHEMWGWAGVYTLNNALTSSTFQFVIMDGGHMNGSHINYFFADNNAGTFYRTAMTNAFSSWGEISGTETTSANAHLKISYDPANLGPHGVAIWHDNDVSGHFRQGMQSNGKHDSEIIFYGVTANLNAADKRELAAHELGHLWGVGDIYNHCNPQISYPNCPLNCRGKDSIYSPIFYRIKPVPTRHDKNALRIGINNPWFDDGTGLGWKRWISPGVFAQNEWDKGYFFNSNQRWVENATFTVSFNANGGSVSPSSAATGANGQLSSSQIPTPTRTGYSFAGWFTTSAASGGTQLTTSTSHVAPTTYWARWIVNTYPVSYNANGGSNPPSTQTKIHGTNLTLTNNVPASPTYTITYNVNGGNALPSNSKTVSRPFKNWNTNSAGTGTSYNRGATYSANAGATLFAQWDNPLAGTLPVPTNGKLFFWGWFTAPTGGNQVTSLTRIKSNTTLYARWSSYPYGVFHFKNAGNGLYLSESETTPPLVPNKILNSDAQRWVVRRLSLSNYYRLDNIVEDLGNMFVGNFKGISVSFGLTNSTMTAVGNSIESLPFDEDSLFQKWNLEAHPITYTQGDINQDGVINTQDFVLAIQFSTGARTPTALQAYLADVNKDGQITQADADMILGMY